MDSPSLLAEELAARWNVRITVRLPGATCSEVWAGIRDAQEVVLKLPHVGTEEATSAAAVRSFSEVGGVRLLETDRGGAMLLERVVPGTNLLSLPEAQTIEIMCRVIGNLRQANPCPAPSLNHWFDRLTPDGRALIDCAANTARRLISTTSEPVLLHGDLHHENLLRHGEEWIAIDPKGLIGDRSFEIAAFMRNPLKEDLTSSRLLARLRRFEQLLGDPIERLWGWSFAEAALDLLWSEDANDNPSRSWNRATALWDLREELLERRHLAEFDLL